MVRGDITVEPVNNLHKYTPNTPLYKAWSIIA